MKKCWHNCVLPLIFCGITGTLLCQSNYFRSGISVASYLLRDRAVVIDSLVMRKCMYVAFRTNHPLSEVRACAVAGDLSHKGVVLARDTTWLFDEAAGNLGFNLPFEIPDGTYKLGIRIISPTGKVLDTFTEEYDRADLKPYFNREIQFWDFTTPYAHLECSGYGIITYQFTSNKNVSDLKGIEISARMNSDNDLPGFTEVLLNGNSVGKYELPAGDVKESLVNWKNDNPDLLKGTAILKGVNQLSFLIKPVTGTGGTGLRIYSYKNSSDPAVNKGIPITLTVKYGTSHQKILFTIPVWGEEGEHITSKFNMPAPESFTQETPEPDKGILALNREDIDQGYVLFNRDYQRYVYPWTLPADKERIDTLDLQMSRNDYEPVTFSIFPLRDLGLVRITVSDLVASDGKRIPSENILKQVVKIMKIRTGEGNNYQLIPRLIDRTDNTNIPLSYTTRFWLTVHANNSTTHGIYQGTIRIESEKEPVKTLPFNVEILPITLGPFPDIDYSMCMSYEFFELDSKDWSVTQKEKIYQDGVNTFRDYLNHGMSTVVIASPYYFQWNKYGNPPVEHYEAMIKAAKEVGFKRPVYWYLGHYVQSAKGQHPGNIRLYNPKIHPERAKFLVETAMIKARELGGPPVYFMPIDEPRIAFRQKITIDLLKAIKKVPGAKTICTTDIGGKLLDIENNSEQDRKPLGPGQKTRNSERKVWEYKNQAIQCRNPSFSRYVYGYYTWRQDLDGMNSWGPATTENSRGNPFEDLDHEYSDYAITYPHAGGPLATPNWEALREGIDDIRYIYQLEKLCRMKASACPNEVSRAEKFMDDIRAMCDFDERSIINDFGDWTPERFESLRKQIIEWVLKLDNL